MATAMPTVASKQVAAVRSLSRAEQRVLEAIARTDRVDDAARDLHLAPNTVRAHLKSIHRKLGVSRRREAIAVARELGLLQDP